MERFRLVVERETGRSIPDSTALHRWSVDEPQRFWRLLADDLLGGSGFGGGGFGGRAGDGVVLVPGAGEVSGAAIAGATWFPDARLNVAERILGGGPTDSELLVSIDERGGRRSTTRAEAVGQVGRIASALRSSGVAPGDVVAAWMPNTTETVLVMLAAASLGAAFTSTSPDFGVDGVLDRFGQVRPRVLVAADGYAYGGREFDRRAELGRVVAGLPTTTTIVVGFLEGGVGGDPSTPAGAVPGTVAFGEWLSSAPDEPLRFEQLPVDHLWYILYSSGTTGVPKCIVHRTGGVLLQHMKEHQLHLDLRPGDRACYFTTCGWMMWNWLVSMPASGVTAVLFEGNPFHPGPGALWELAERERLDFLGVSAKYLDAVRTSGLRPADAADLSRLRTLASTGSPLSPEGFEWVAESVAPGAGPDGLHLASISGGTDLCGCFAIGDPTRPVYAGELQGPALGMAVDVWTPSGAPAAVGERGELVCTQPFPSTPLRFWGDEDPDRPGVVPGPRYRSAYFEGFRDVWTHGDFAARTEHGGLVIHGRSDTTLNPGGVRIGTAEIYRQVEQVDGVLESLVFGQDVDDDVRIVLLVRLADGAVLDDDLVAEIRGRVRTGCTPRHVPAVVVQVDDLPRTRSNKLAELAVADRVNGREVRNTGALANPEALDHVAERVPEP
jgi:acetoacetyl-CoA synthetase